MKQADDPGQERGTSAEKLLQFQEVIGWNKRGGRVLVKIIYFLLKYEEVKHKCLGEQKKASQLEQAGTWRA